MFGIFNKKRRKDRIDNQVMDAMKKFSDETEKVYRNQISYLKNDFPKENIEVSNYGIYKARLATNLMISLGARFSKSKIGFTSNEDFLDDIKIATAIAYSPFSNSNSSEYLDRDELRQKTEEIIKYIITTINDNQLDIYELKFKENDDFFKRIKIYFHNCISESIPSKDTMSRIINDETIYFLNLTRQNLKIMSDFMKI